VLAAAAPCVDAACKLVKIGEIPVSVQDVPVAPVSLDGHPARLIVDTRNATAGLERGVCRIVRA